MCARHQKAEKENLDIFPNLSHLVIALTQIQPVGNEAARSEMNPWPTD